VRRGNPFLRQPHRRAQGKLGEDRAEQWLRRRGYQILRRNVRTRAGEIDLVGLEEGVLCYVEVKARASDLFGTAIHAVPFAKQRRLARAAALDLASHPHAGPCRFDVLAMDLEGDIWRFTLVKDAFQVPGS
jgi:putative endonuclease